MEMPDADSAVPQSPVSGNVPSARGLPLVGSGTGSTPRLGGMSLRISFMPSGSLCPVAVSSEPESESLDLICVNDPGSSPSVCVISPSSWPEPSCSLPANSDSAGVTSRSGVVPLMCGMRMVDGGPGGSPRTLPRYRPFADRPGRSRPL